MKKVTIELKTIDSDVIVKEYHMMVPDDFNARDINNQVNSYRYLYENFLAEDETNYVSYYVTND